MAPNQKRFVLKLANYCECEGCSKTLKNLLDIDGVHSTPIDAKTWELTVSGPVDPQKVISFLKKKGKIARLVTEPKTNNRRKAQIEGVDSIDIDKDLELGKGRKATISGNVDPQTVIKKPKDRAKKHAELLGKEEEGSPPKINHQETQIVLHQNRVRIDQRKVAPQPPALISKSVREHCDPKHDHELELKSYNKPFNCNRCREYGFTSGYRCKHCVYDLHEVCWKPKPKITHDLFPGSIFELSKKPGKFCDACGMEIHGHSYSCKEDKLDLHPACSKLPGKLPISGTDFVLCKEVKYKCFFCKKKKPSWFAETKVTGLCYVSERNKFSCHVHCLSLVMQEAWKRGRGDLDRNNDNDAISRALGKVDLKPVATAKGSGGEGGGLFLGAVTIFLKTIISILFGDPTGLIVSALTELVKELLTL